MRVSDFVAVETRGKVELRKNLNRTDAEFAEKKFFAPPKIKSTTRKRRSLTRFRRWLDTAHKG